MGRCRDFLPGVKDEFSGESKRRGEGRFMVIVVV